MPRPSSTALTIAHVVLRILIVLNWIYGAIDAGDPHRAWSRPSSGSMTALGIPASAETRPLVMGMRAIAALGLVSRPAQSMSVLRRLLAIVDTVRAGDPFVAANAYRLQAIAWVLLAQQLLSLVIALIGKAVSTPGPPAAPRRRLLAWRLARRDPDLRPRPRVRRRHADARRPRRDGVMAIVVKLDELLHERRMTLTELAERIDITLANLSILKTGKARAIRFSTLEAICQVLRLPAGRPARIPARVRCRRTIARRLIQEISNGFRCCISSGDDGR